jgi:hypothetical protein
LKISFGMGLILCVLVPIVLLLFGSLTISQTASGILLLAGLWAVAHGLAFGRSSDRLYNVGAGVIVVAISTFIFFPVEYVLGFVLIAVIVIVLAAVVVNGRKTK